VSLHVSVQAVKITDVFFDVLMDDDSVTGDEILNVFIFELLRVLRSLVVDGSQAAVAIAQHKKGAYFPVSDKI
jgi:hypothetical protein